MKKVSDIVVWETFSTPPMRVLGKASNIYSKAAEDQERLSKDFRKSVMCTLEIFQARCNYNVSYLNLEKTGKCVKEIC